MPAARGYRGVDPRGKSKPTSAPPARLLARDVPGKDAAAVGLDDAADEGQPQAVPRPLGRPGARRVAAHEGLEGPLGEALAESPGRGRARRRGRTSPSRETRISIGSVRRVPVRPRVDEQVLHGPREQGGVEVDGERSRPRRPRSPRWPAATAPRRRGLEATSTRPRLSLRRSARPVRATSSRSPRIASTAAELLLDVVERGAGGVLDRRRRPSRPGGGRARSRGRRPRATERRPQLVADGAEQLALPAHHRLDAVGHAVEAHRDVAHLLSDPAPTRRRPGRCGTARSPPPKRSAAWARCSSGRASWLATPPAIAESAATTRKSASANLHQAHGTGRGPKRSISSAPSSRSPRTTGTKMCCGAVRGDGSAALGDAAHVPGQAARVAHEAHVEARDVAHLAHVGARRDRRRPRRPRGASPRCAPGPRRP